MIHPNDIPVLVKCFFPAAKTTLVVSPKGSDSSPNYYKNIASLPKQTPSEIAETVFVNLSTAAIPNQPYLGVIQWGIHKGGTPFTSIKNPDGTLRWIIPAAQKNAFFLHLYNGSGWRGRLVKTYWKWAARLGLISRLGGASFTVFTSKSGFWFDTIKQAKKATDLALFTGTKGENRKAVLALGQEQKATWFAKRPLTAAAEKLVAHEEQMLLKANQFQLKNWAIPQVAPSDQALVISNVRPQKSYSPLELSPIHLSRLSELQQASQRMSTLRLWYEQQQISDRLVQLQQLPAHPELAQKEVQELVQLLQKNAAHSDLDQDIELSLAHGDFTPWNLFLTKQQQLHIYDWELAAEHPVGFDAFHFLLQKNILIQRNTATQIMEQVEELLAIQKSYTPLAWQLYLIHHISYYLLRYLQQKDLHVQVHWQIKTWLEVLREI